MGHDKRFENFDKSRRKNEIYGNYLVLSDTGAEMFRCLKKKADWYLTRSLAKIISEDPPVIQLTFKPKKEGWNGDPYYLSQKENICVQCGNKDVSVLTKHHIVPYSYRKFMPIEIKQSSSIDIMPLCHEHHANYETKADELKHSIAKQYNAPLHNKMSKQKIVFKNAKTAAYLKLNMWNSIPDEKKEVLNNNLFLYFGHENYTSEDLVKASNLDYKKDTNSEYEHAQLVMSQVKDLQAFVEMWRTHFIEHVNPQFLPHGWDLKRTIYRQQ